MSECTLPPGRGSEGQTFLVGPTLYLRGLEAGDAKTTPAWSFSPFPVPAEVAEERLKSGALEAAERGRSRLIACRIVDDRPVGSANLRIEYWRNAWLTVHVNSTFGDEARARIKAEIIGLVVPWLVKEHDLMLVVLETEAGEPAIEAVVAEIGMRQAYRLREAYQRDGGRRDLIAYEALHPAWVARLGPPPEAVEGPVERAVRSPAPRVWPALEGDPPRNAVMVGPRVYLRPLEAEDAEQIARWFRQETETFFDSRSIHSPITIAAWHRKLAEADPPSWIRFAIARRENDELIGANGLTDVDWIHRTAETETEIYRPEYRGGGYGTEAKHLLLTYAFDRLGFHMVKSYVWEPNTRSAAALRKQGYRDAGRLAWSGLKDGQFVGDLAFDLLAAEWRAARQ